MKPRTQLLLILVTVIVGTGFVLLMKQYNPLSEYDGYHTDRVLYFKVGRATDRIELQVRDEEDGTESQRIVQISKGFISTTVTEVDLDTLNLAGYEPAE
ncbi:MAG: hypothetical protein HWE14_13385 [Flavobacteriia bacterium]|nr:hypothetical protein [Flavobacteriia bacterium]